MLGSLVKLGCTFTNSLFWSLFSPAMQCHISAALRELLNAFKTSATWDEEKGQKATSRTTLWNLPRLSTHSSTCGEKDEWAFFEFGFYSAVKQEHQPAVVATDAWALHPDSLILKKWEYEMFISHSP